MTQFKLETDADGIALVTWDSPSRSMNVLDGDVLAELSAIIEKTTAEAAVKGVVVTSGKDSFCAGAGGTTRIARMMQPADALQFLLKGDQLNLDRAKGSKLVDAVVPMNEMVKAGKDWIKAGGSAKKPWDTDGFRLPGGPVYAKG